MNRRGFLTGLIAAPAVILTPGLLMPVRAQPIWTPRNGGRYYEVNFFKNDEWIGGTNPNSSSYFCFDFGKVESFGPGDIIGIEMNGWPA
jgi:hypothetical protein